jgi:nitrate/nitrite transporter NarK
MDQNISVSRRFLIIFSIVFAGEMIFSLPFHVARFFRPTLLDVFNITNTQLGDIFALYGILAMLAYFPGGAIADRFSGRRLMVISLVSTALGGIYFIQIPSINGLALLFAYWGVTTILLFWAAMIKVTRQWGGISTQGRSFGILDGGRGLVAATIASLAVLMMGMILPENTTAANVIEQVAALKTVIVFYSLMTLLAAMLIWFIIPKQQVNSTLTTANSAAPPKFRSIVMMIIQPKIWAQAMIVLAAYCAYKGMDYFGLYATTVMALTDLESANLVSNASYLRPIAAIGAGILADRLGAGKLISWGFAILSLCYLVFCFVEPQITSTTMIIEMNFFLSFFLVFAIRGIYFALLEESKVLGHLTGTAVGIISVIGFTPDIFFAPIAGRILDATPGVEGFNQLFIFLISLSLFGFISALMLTKIVNKNT